ncbi:MAG: UbiD family decarboxylase [Thermodesulfobacteriota bacterium]|nr:UbiD family decarboxylase [Thermodesulfobacteriota bacterium]
MAFKDLREFLNLLEEKRELVRITEEVDWDEEIGALSQEAIFRKAPAFICENIRDAKDTPGKKLAMNYLCGWKRINLALGLPIDTPPREIVSFWKNRIKNPIKPVVIKDGPCKENIKKGEEVNLYDFPQPKLHSLDGGRYMLTWHLDITKDPDSEWVNCGLYRGMVLDRNSIGRLVVPVQHWAMHGRKYQAQGKKLPLAVSIGTDPVGVMVACAQFPTGVNEYDMWGAVRGEPVELVKCETLDLMVPAQSEIVLEGEIDLNPETFRLEGPFGEYPGYYSSVKPEKRPVFKVNCVTYRNDPILTSGQIGLGPNLVPADCDYMTAISNVAQAWDHLERCGVEGIENVAFDLNSVGTVIYIAIKKLYYGHAKQVAAALWGGNLSIYLGKYVIVVDSDIDVWDRGMVTSAICNRTFPGKDIVIYPGTFGGVLDPGTPVEIKQKVGGVGHWDRVLIDATWPFEWEAKEEWGGERHPLQCISSPVSLDKVRTKWEKYGFF